MGEFNPKVFGERLRALRGKQTQEKLASLAGLPDYLIARYERGDTDKPSYQYIIKIGNALGYSPNEIAALADLYVMPGFENEQLGQRNTTLRQLENVFMTLSEDEQANILEVISLMIETANRRRNAPPAVREEEPDPLPPWFNRRIKVE